ncbi:hypothetical protein C8A01DRAFT_41617 [Parachaetomium inaequale]|uniref:Stress-response A/B barrel domain-containing protein n=1 Tax=Parachaetomium inaequale TaxID=2588326 RepID=A0AAN6P548_9PEZI|nr:hypothetical protein C8A01DRAFT_41617 [Parachaetomium inaequale]
MGKIIRDTLFIVPKPANQDKLLDAYKELEKNQAKDGKPYILHIHATRLLNDERSLGHTVKATMTFANHEDMVYYDKECPAHAALKHLALDIIEARPIVLNAEVTSQIFPNY